MKKSTALSVTCIFFAVLSIILLFFTASKSNAADRSIHAEWTKYTAPVGITTASFNLYKDGVLACNFKGPDIVAGDCTVDLVKLQTPFTLSALFSDGKESPQSTAFVLTDYGPGPVGLKITIVTIRTVSSINKNGRPTSTTTITKAEAKPGQVVKQGVSPGYRNSKGEWVTITTLVM